MRLITRKYGNNYQIKWKWTSVLLRILWETQFESIACVVGAWIYSLDISLQPWPNAPPWQLISMMSLQGVGVLIHCCSLVFSTWYCSKLEWVMSTVRPTTRRHYKVLQGSYSLLFTCFLYMILFKGRTSHVYSKANYKKRHKCIRDNYLVGKASQPYTQAPTPTVQRSLEKAGPSSSISSMERCSRCFPVLQWYKDQLEQLVQQEPTLKKRMKQHPHTCTKQLQTSPYQDFNAQNTWLRNNFSMPWRTICFVTAVSVKRSLYQVSVCQGKGE